MKFISTITKEGAPFIFEARLDTSIFRTPSREGDTLSASFDVEKTVPSLPYFRGTEMSIFVEVSKENIYTSAILFVGCDGCHKKLSPYEEDCMIPFDVSLSDEEKLKILLFFINCKNLT